MDNLIRKVITIGLPALMLFIATAATGKTGDDKQFAAIGEYAAQVKNPVVVVGDLNTTMWSPFYKSMVKTARLRNARSGFGILPTWPTFMPLLSIPIDHLLVSKEIGVLKVHTGRYVGSDHLPLITDLIIAGSNNNSGLTGMI